MSAVRGSSLRARLSRTLVGLGLVSVVLFSGVNFFVVRSLLDSNVREQLVTLRDLRRNSIEGGIDRLLAGVSVLATDPAVVAAVQDLDRAYVGLDTELDADQLDELKASYDDVVRPYDQAGVERPDIESLVPPSSAGRYVQYQYVSSNPNAADQRDELLDAGDGSDYSSAHAEYHQYLRSLRDGIGGTDLLLVGASSKDVVYSVSKRVDLGTDVLAGPYQAAGLGESVSLLGQAAVNDAVIVDSAYYLPDSTAPVAHVAAIVRLDAQVVGAIVISVPIDRLTAIVTADQQWDLLGLGNTGEAYVIGADLTLRTVPRLWFEDPDEYLKRFSDNGGIQRTADLIEFTGSPVLLQSVDNDAVRLAFDGQDFVGIVDSYLGHRTLTAATKLDVPGLDWVVVTELQTSETRDVLERFLTTIGLLLLVLLPILAIVGLFLARVLARPVEPLVAAARRIADGDFDTEVPDLGRNELGDLGAQLRAVTARLREKEQEIEQEEQHIATMLESILPAALVERIRRGERDMADLVDTGTVISVAVRGLPEPTGVEQDAVLELTARLSSELHTVAQRHGVERIRVASDQQMFVAGRGAPGAGTAAVLPFSESVIALVDALGSEFGVALSAHIGLAAGLVATGVLGTRQVSFGMWGDCVGTAISLSAAAGAGEILADRSVVDELGDRCESSLVDEQGEAFRLRSVGADVVDRPGIGDATTLSDG